MKTIQASEVDIRKINTLPYSITIRPSHEMTVFNTVSSVLRLSTAAVACGYEENVLLAITYYASLRFHTTLLELTKIEARNICLYDARKDVKVVRDKRMAIHFNNLINTNFNGIYFKQI